MRTDLCARAVHQGGMRVDVRVREHILAMDYPAEAGRNPTPLEVLLASLAGCAATTLRVALSKMGEHLDSIEVEARAERRTEHPTILTAIELIYHLGGNAVEPRIVDQAIRVAEELLCPVMAMLRPGTSIRSSWVAETVSVHG